jgi:hypothetical protein
MKRLALAVACLAALSLTAAPASQAAFKTGISDQVPEAFLNPLYAPLNLTTARYITPWDVMSLPAGNPTRDALDRWITNATAARQDILISFEHSHTRGREKRAPRASTFRRAVVNFLRAYPSVRSISPWNEVNRCNRTQPGGLVVGQPRKLCRTSSGPRLAASYYRQTVSACRAVRRRCRIVALDILDQADVKPAVRYVKRFRRFARPRPKIWGIHNYSDTNRFSTKRTRALLRATRRGEVWLTETGGIVKFGSQFPFNERRAARALRCMFRIARSNRRIKRLFIYNFSPGPANTQFESGLVRLDGTRRPGYNVVRRRQAGRC